MAATSSMFSVGFIVFVLLSVTTTSAEERSATNAMCVDGMYAHGARNCCLCAAGQHLVNHCTTDQQFGKCEPCATNTYSNQPTYQKSCEPCTSCSHTNADLELEEPCTPASDAKCRCKKDHYCSSSTETCTLCNPCTECPEGIKEACSAKSDTICNDKTEGGNNTGIIIAIIVPILLIALAVAIFAYVYRKNRSRREQHNAVEILLLNVSDVELQPHLPDIAKVIGWKDMQEVAMRSSIMDTVIDSCKLNHPGDSQEWTLELLKVFVEKHGKEAPRKLIEILQDSDKRGKAESVQNILCPKQTLPA
ncbi:tumor necrosis factor receptor superfamily member 6 [Anoplopoma fimbria]|uniref:tumor necrosis factor receptor superfamily member 6 n=1 Tax=Anoplopoma fimbria TaxID=229290 RepID=UPI0023EB7141|nr:tumor necrosis factor receptor superfamily member 6 [Anoplopoma fimbria]